MLTATTTMTTTSTTATTNSNNVVDDESYEEHVSVHNDSCINITNWKTEATIQSEKKQQFENDRQQLEEQRDVETTEDVDDEKRSKKISHLNKCEEERKMRTPKVPEKKKSS